MMKFRATFYILMLALLPMLLFDGIYTHSYEKILTFIFGIIGFGYQGVLELIAPIILIDKDQLKIRCRYRLEYKEYKYNIVDFIEIETKKAALFNSIILKNRESKDVYLPIWTMGRKKQKILTHSIARYFSKDNSWCDKQPKKE